MQHGPGPCFTGAWETRYQGAPPPVSGRWTKWAREPLLQFLLIGACIYGLYEWKGAPDEDPDTRMVVVDTVRIEGFISGWQQRFDRSPTEQELDAMVQQFVREDILSREAMAMGLGDDDPITRRRMAQKLEFLTRDLVRLKEPAEGELEQYFAEHEAEYREPDLITFSHVFIDPDRRGDATLEDAAGLLEALSAAGEPDADALRVGDRFMGQNYYPGKAELEIRRHFGGGFSLAVMELEPGRWHGPVLSGYGTHLVYVHSLEVAPPARFEDVRDDVFASWQEAEENEFNEQYFESLKERYEIVIEEVATPPSASVVRQAGMGAVEEPAS